ncbi:MAG: hypothetical protein II312_00270 [Lachnospiraceae bacterium]|nr:hypothetical protein [Lachnospiraceae bacterium]
MIYDANSVDIIGERQDGGIDFIIISSGAFDDSPEQQTILLDKIENYIAYLNSKSFSMEFPQIDKGKRWIKLRCEEKPTPLLTELGKKIEEWVIGEGLLFSIEMMH